MVARTFVALGLTLFGYSALSGSVLADALSQPPVCSTRFVLPANSDLDADDARDTAEAWIRTGQGCQSFQDKRGGRHLFVFLDAGPSRDEGAKGKAKLQPVHLGVYDFVTDVYNNRYLAPAIELQPGDTLHIRSTNCLDPLPKVQADKVHVHGQLPQDGTPKDASAFCRQLGLPSLKNGAPYNLHTHGLIVSPRNDIRHPLDPQRPGDNIYAATLQGQYLDYTISIPNSIPRSVLLNPEGEGPDEIGHPGGLYWYHPHIHGIAAYQVTSGLSGVISIGDPFDVMIPPRLEGERDLAEWQTRRWREEQRARTDVRYVELRDIQLQKSAAPDKSGAHYVKLDEANTTLCGNPMRINGNTDPNSGWAFPTGGDYERFKGGCRNADKVWLFPLNDKIYPAIEVGEDRDMIMRLSNQSASVTYRLSLRSGYTPPTPTAPEVSGDALPFEIIGIDGVVSGAGGPVNTKQKRVYKSQTEDEIIMMPASRADILIRNGFPSAQRGKPYELVTRQVDMSLTVDETGAPQADVWPDIPLASIVLNGPKGDMTPAQAALQPMLSERAIAAKVSAKTQTKTFERGARSQKRESHTPEITNADYPGCVDNLTLGSNVRRIIVFDHSPPGVPEVFKLGYSRASNAPGSETIKIPSQPFPEAIDWKAQGEPTKEHLCVAMGEEEVWELRNVTNEVHNFHIHQSKFRLATRQEVARVTEPSLVKQVCPDQGNGPCGADPIGYTTRAHFGLIKGLQGPVNVLHDTFPIPPASFEGNTVKEPGRIFIKVGFHAGEQVGRFVYHCHILEHEDKGMMAPIEVIDVQRKTAETPSPFARLAELAASFLNPAAAAEADVGEPLLNGPICRAKANETSAEYNPILDPRQRHFAARLLPHSQLLGDGGTFNLMRR